MDIVSFDLDGTLVNTASEIAEAANRALESHGLARRPPEEITLLIGAGTRELMLRLLAQVFEQQPELRSRVSTQAVLDSLDTHYAQTTGTDSAPYGGTLDALLRLRAADVRLACVTNKEYRHAVRLLQVHQLLEHFDLVIGGDTLPIKKPHAGVLQHVMSTLGGQPHRTAHVGDSHTDVQAARQAGVAAWVVPYGYNAGVPIAQSEPDRLFDDLGAVADHVLAAPRPVARPANP